MTRPLAILAALALTACAPTLNSRAHTVTHDPGGLILERQAQIAQLRAERRSVAVTGLCASACTMYLTLAADGLLCTTRDARWGFHGIVAAPTLAPEWREILVTLIAMHYPAEIARQYRAHWQHIGANALAIVSGGEMIDRHGVPECR
jgi:hypothetical protein